MFLLIWGKFECIMRTLGCVIQNLRYVFWTTSGPPANNPGYWAKAKRNTGCRIYEFIQIRVSLAIEMDKYGQIFKT